MFPFIDASTVPVFLQVFLVVNVLLINIGSVLVLEVKKGVSSEIWSNIIKGNLWDIIYGVSVALILNRLYQVTGAGGRNTLMLAAFFHLFATVMLVVVIYLLVKPVLRRKLNLLEPKYMLIYVLSVLGGLGFLRILPLLKFRLLKK